MYQIKIKAAERSWYQSSATTADTWADAYATMRAALATNPLRRARITKGSALVYEA